MDNKRLLHDLMLGFTFYLILILFICFHKVHLILKSHQVELVVFNVILEVQSTGLRLQSILWVLIQPLPVI